MEVFIISFLVIAPAEMADKTQLLALLLASRFRKPAPVIAGMLAALLVSHFTAGLVGQLLGNSLKGNTLHWLLSLSLFAAAIWAFIPDRLEEGVPKAHSHHSIFITTFISFIIAELGDKTQLATVALTAQFHTLIPVALGTTAGMMAVNTPVIIFNHLIGDKIPIRAIRTLSGILFAALGIYELSKIFL